MLRSAAYMLGALVVTALVHLYVHRRLVRDAEVSSAWRRRARILTLVMATLLPAGMAGLLLMHDLPRWAATPLMACAFGWVGLLVFALPILFAGEAVRVLPTNPDRRRAMARAIAMVTGAATLGLGGAAAVTAQLAPIVRRLRVSPPGWKRKGYTVVQVSDLHVSATIGRALVERIVASINALEPDLVAITGDLVDGPVRELGPLVAPLKDLRARDGVWFVTGNHEYLSGVDEWLAHLPSIGIRVLRNQHVSIGDFDLVGIDDPSGASDLEAAVRGRDPSRASILLAHRPDGVHAASAHGIGLQISGHTHGGQISPLGWAVERAHQPYVFGLYEIGETLLYVTSGAGYWGPPMRLGTRAEIVVFELG